MKQYGIFQVVLDYNDRFEYDTGWASYSEEEAERTAEEWTCKDTFGDTYVVKEI